MHIKRAVPICLVAWAACAASMSAHAGFNGTSFTTFYAFPDLVSVYGGATASSPSFNVGAGIETTVDVEGVTSLAVDFDDSSLRILFNTTLASPTWSSAAFNGLVFDLASVGVLPFSSADLAGITTDMAGFGAAQVGLTSNRITLDWNGLAYADGTQIVLNFTPAVPEPSSYVLMALGLAAVAGVARKKQKTTASA